ncbi:bifunctional monodehydroascorbate reductase and carbonic anhydrase nectarin-3-like, partial [Phalaenopsis equestris]|uniref:bifunctional monodehydroascorbate reductase and carbonic anhydrase nectarin-3-like n=1 Tax=Phalaenopsis equestris TaxID=78828 RepID=UPI0009E2B20E
YSLKQMHWHMPSENIINGHRFDLEVHLLHQQTTGHKMAMISNLFKVGDPDPFFTKVERHISTIKKNIGAKVDIGIIDPKKVSRMTKKYYRLMGSITIPPCTEDVTWTINKKISTISTKQLNLLKEATIDDYATNGRP